MFGASRLNSLARLLEILTRAAKTITTNGVAKVSTDQSEFGGASLFTPSSGGANDNLSLPFQTDLLWSESTDYTMECWVYHTAWPTSAGYPTVGIGEGSAVTFLVGRSTGFVRWCFGFNATGKLTFDYNTSAGFGGTTVQESGTSGTLNDWYHIALVKQSSTVKGYVNGIEKFSTTVSGTVSNGTGTEVPRIGGHYWSTACYYDEIRWSNSARYTANFTAPTAPFINDSNTVLLIHADGANNSTVFTDDTTGTIFRGKKGITTYGNAQVSTAQSKFGGASALFDGTSDYLSTATNANFGFGTGDFTIEGWFYKTSAGTQYLFDTRTALNENSVAVQSNSSGNLRLFVNGAFVLTSSNAHTNNAWNHLAISRASGVTRFFINGVVSTTTYTDTTNYGTTKPLVVGAQYNGTTAFAGYIDDFRVSNTARYTATFTPTTTAFVNDANTLLLIHADGANASTTFTDDAPGELTSLTAMEVVNAVTATTTTIVIPAFALVDDYAVLFDTSTTTTLTVPSGWTQVTTSTTTGIRSTVSYKKLAFSDLATTITGMAGTTRKILTIVRGNAPIQTITISTPAQQATTAAPTNQTLSMSSPASPLVGFAHYTATGAISTRTGASSVAEFTSATNQYVKVWTYIPTTGANQTIGMSDSGTNALQSFFITFT